MPTLELLGPVFHKGAIVRPPVELPEADVAASVADYWLKVGVARLKCAPAPDGEPPSVVAPTTDRDAPPLSDALPTPAAEPVTEPEAPNPDAPAPADEPQPVDVTAPRRQKGSRR